MGEGAQHGEWRRGSRKDGERTRNGNQARREAEAKPVEVVSPERDHPSSRRGHVLTTEMSGVSVFTAAPLSFL